MFPIRNDLTQGYALLPLLFQLLVYAGDMNVLGWIIQTIEKNAESLVVTCKEKGLEVKEINADMTKYMVMSQDQNAGWSHSTKIDNSCFGRVRTTLANQNSIQKEINSSLKSGTARYHLVKNHLSSNFLFKNLKSKIYRTIILAVVVYGCETWSLTLR
jgi:hypothetical protein